MSTNRCLTGILIADLHIGAIRSDLYAVQLDEILIRRIRHMKQLDFVVFLGDYFDAKYFFHSQPIQFGISLAIQLLDVTKPLNTKFVWIEGTRTHDSFQPEQIVELLKASGYGDRVQYVSTVSEDELCGMKVLYIPEEYVIDPDTYYHAYFTNKHYDMIFGHGMADVIYYAKKGLPTEKVSSSPVFSVEQLTSIANYTYFGHVHEHRGYGPGKKFWYLGPVTVWEFDKASESGFTIIEYDRDNQTALTEYVVNDLALRLKTRELTFQDPIEVFDVQSKLTKAIDNTDEDPYDRLRLKVTINGELENALVIRDLITSTISMHPEIKLLIDTVYPNQQVSDVQEQEEMEKRTYLHEENLSDEGRIAEFIKVNFNTNVQLESIIETIGGK